MRSNVIDWVLGCCLAAAMLGCGSEPGEESTLAASAACTQGTMQPCACSDGSPGMKMCQLDGTLSVCKCASSRSSNAPGPAAGAAAPSGNAGVSANPPPVPMPAGGPMPAMGAAPMATVAETIIVPPEDVAACAGVGTPPSAEENVEVMEVRTDQVVWQGKTYPVVAGGYTPEGGTSYSCFWVELDMPEKHHIIGWEGAVGSRGVHHQQVSVSAPPSYLKTSGQQGGGCGLPSVEYTWTGEQPTEWAPPLAGYPLGGPDNDGKATFLWQTHFEGQTTPYTGGFNAYVTKNLRKYDAGNFEQGDISGILIPAGQSAMHTATCTPEMTTEKLTQPIYVFSSMLHAHSTIQRIQSEHWRNGQLLETLGDETVSFGFVDQRFKPHTPCVQLLPGDELRTICNYTNPTSMDIMGGPLANQEMCTTFMQYFPRLPQRSSNFCGSIGGGGGGVRN